VISPEPPAKVSSEGPTPASPPSAPPATKVSRRDDKPKAKSPPEPTEQELEVEKGTLDLQVEPSAQVFKVLLDGFQVGRTPLPLAELEPGIYTLELVDDQQKKVATRRFRVSAGQIALVKVNLSRE
jgi:hypothetical protein